MNLYERREALRQILQDKIDGGDLFPSKPIEQRYRRVAGNANVIVLRSDEMKKYDWTRREVSLGLQELEDEKRIYAYEGQGGTFRVWTTPEYFATPNLTNTELFFDANTGVLKYGGRRIFVRQGTNQYHVCRALFPKGQPAKKRVSEETILARYFHEKDFEGSPRKVRDAVNGLNAKVARETGKDNLFEFQGSAVRVNP